MAQIRLVDLLRRSAAAAEAAAAGGLANSDGAAPLHEAAVQGQCRKPVKLRLHLHRKAGPHDDRLAPAREIRHLARTPRNVVFRNLPEILPHRVFAVVPMTLTVALGFELHASQGQLASIPMLQRLLPGEVQAMRRCTSSAQAVTAYNSFSQSPGTLHSIGGRLGNVLEP